MRLLILVVVFAMSSWFCAEHPRRENPYLGVEESIAEAFFWEHHWFGYWGDEFQEITSQGAGELHGLAARGRDADLVHVCIDEIRSIFYCYRNGEFVVRNLTSYNDTNFSSNLNTQQYEDQRHAKCEGGAPITVELGPQSQRLTRFGEFDGEKASLVEEIFEEILKTEDVLAFMKGQVNTHPSVLRLRVGNFPSNTHWIYYYVEGAPYLGVIQWDSRVRRLVHHELKYMNETPAAPRFLNAKRRIDEDGAWFILTQQGISRQP